MNLKKHLPAAVVILLFIVASLLYFHPVLKGQQIQQSDITQFKGMAQEIVVHRASTGEEPYWLGAAFSGMPAYQVSAYFPNDFVLHLDKLLRFLPRPADYVFLYFLGFFVLLSVLKVPKKLALIGALSFGFSTYLIIILGVGHNAKAHAIAYMPFVLAGVLLMYQRKHLQGFFLTGLAMSLEIYTNHPQMTYYLGFFLLILGLVFGAEAYKKQALPLFIKQSLLLVFAMVLAVGVNATRLLSMKEYAAHSTRGASELTIHPDGTPKETSEGLSTAYITEYSYGITETFNLLIPRFTGGGTVEELGTSSHFYQTLKPVVGAKQAKMYAEQAFTYWGEQPIVEAPAYIGAVLVFLFLLGAFLVQGRLKTTLVTVAIFSILMSWGKNFEFLTDFCIQYVPLYNKFRAVSSIQVLVELAVPLLGMLALKEFLSPKTPKERKVAALKKAVYVLGGITLFFALFGASLFAFEGLRDAQYAQLPGLVDAIIADRKDLLQGDSFRSFGFIVGTALILGGWLKGKLKETPVLVLIGLLILVDLIPVATRYVNAENFTTARKVQNPFTASVIDTEILKDTAHYRVANFAGNPMQDARTSYFHQSIGGYHAAKMGRYQELFDFQIAKNNTQVLNMLHAKYILFNGENGMEYQENLDTNGNAWFVNRLVVAENPTQELTLLDSLQTKQEAVLSRSDFNALLHKKQTLPVDTTARIRLEKYALTTLEYRTKTQQPQVAVFSEMYYKDGWNAYIDGVKTPHFRVNYVLRAMEIPVGEHQITFVFEPKVIQYGKQLSLVSYLLLIGVSLGWFLYEKKKK